MSLFMPIAAPYTLIPYTEDEHERLDNIMLDAVRLAMADEPFTHLFADVPFPGKIFILHGLDAMPPDIIGMASMIFLAPEFHTIESLESSQKLRTDIERMFDEIVRETPRAALLGYHDWLDKHNALAQRVSAVFQRPGENP